MTDRRIKLPTVRNCRDLGSLETADGRHIKADCMLRCAELSETSPEDLLALHDKHRLSCVLDLRTYKEVDERPNQVIDEVTNLHTPVFNGFRRGVSHEEGSEEKAREKPFDMADMYYFIMTGEETKPNISEVLKKIMTYDYDNGSVLWHCYEGKDRCGIITMLILMALGVDYSAIMEDYLMTNEINVARADAFYNEAVENGEDPERAKIIYDMFLARERYLNRAHEPSEQYEDVYDYFLNEFGITRETIDSFRCKVLE